LACSTSFRRQCEADRRADERAEKALKELQGQHDVEGDKDGVLEDFSASELLHSLSPRLASLLEPLLYPSHRAGDRGADARRHLRMRVARVKEPSDQPAHSRSREDYEELPHWGYLRAFGEHVRCMSSLRAQACKYTRAAARETWPRSPAARSRSTFRGTSPTASETASSRACSSTNSVR
jgi:hypothetical protein